LVAAAHGHGFLKRPLARTATHLEPEFNPVYNPPYSWNYEGHWCTHDDLPQDQDYSTCPRCADVDSNQDGMYDKQVITATYQAGALIEVEASFGANHNGHYFIELCPQERETDGCFQRLPIVSGSTEVRDGSRICVVDRSGAQQQSVTAQVWLPAGVRCERCTLRWTYRTSYGGWADWDKCDNPHPAQTFRNCADIKIV